MELNIDTSEMELNKGAGKKETDYINRQILKVGFILIGISLTFCMVFIYYCKLEEPVFLYHYYEEEFQMNETPFYQVLFNIYYITNRSDSRTVTGVSFKEAPEILFHATEGNNGNTIFIHNNSRNQLGEAYGNYSLRSVYVSISYNGELKNLDGIQLSQATFDFSDGTQMGADIGKIVLYKPEYLQGYLDDYSTSSSSDGSSSAEMHVKNKFSLIKIDSPLMDKVDKFFEIKVDGHSKDDIKGISYDSGDRMIVTNTLKPTKDIIDQLSFFDLKPGIYFKTDKGTTYTKRICNLEYNIDYREFTQIQILKYLKARGEALDV
ncbi:MAG: hypothetical protein WCD89_06655 [Anaerocolumna sp.]